MELGHDGRHRPTKAIENSETPRILSDVSLERSKHDVESEEGAADASWKLIWARRRPLREGGTVLGRLLSADGYDTAYGRVTEQAWTEFVRSKILKLGARSDMSVYDVGCGAGAFIYDLYTSGFTVGGIDQSAVLINEARMYMPDGEFQVGDATEIDISQKFDIVLSCGAFLYFSTLEYAETVVNLMVAKARHAVALLDLPDRALRDAELKERQAALGGEEAYAHHYRGLAHLHFDRDWVRNKLIRSGLTDVEVEGQQVQGYRNGKYRFNAWGFKPDPER